MKDSFDLKKYLIENKVTRSSRLTYEDSQSPTKNNQPTPTNQSYQNKITNNSGNIFLEKIEKIILQLDENIQKLFLLEVSIEDLKIQFVDSGKVAEKDFQEVVNASGNKTAYATWLLKKFVSGLINVNDIYKYKGYFDIFDRNKKQYPEQDINRYKTQNDLETFVTTSIEIGKKEQEDLSKQKGISKEDKYKKLYIGSVDGFNVHKIPQGSTELYKTSCELGSGTNWCTATGKTDKYFNQYIKYGPLYIFTKPGSDEKYQFHYEKEQFMDKNDNPII